MAWPVVDDGLRLDVHRVACAAKGYHGRIFRWTWQSNDAPVGWINISVAFHGERSGTLNLKYRSNDVPFDQRFELDAEPCRFGGVRWFAICPVTRSRAAKLYSLGGAGFHARARYTRVAYRTQRAPKPADGAILRRDRILFRKLKGDDPGFVEKPKWMRWKTYDRLMMQLELAESELDAHLMGMIARLGGFRR